jgi:hypothetical protein
MAEFEQMMKIMNEALLGPGFSDDGVCAAVKRPLHPAVKIYALHRHVSINGVAEAALVQFLGNEYQHGWKTISEVQMYPMTATRSGKGPSYDNPYHSDESIAFSLCMGSTTPIFVPLTHLLQRYSNIRQYPWLLITIQPIARCKAFKID